MSLEKTWISGDEIIWFIVSEGQVKEGRAHVWENFAVHKRDYKKKIITDLIKKVYVRARKLFKFFLIRT